MITTEINLDDADNDVSTSLKRKRSPLLEILEYRI